MPSPIPHHRRRFFPKRRFFLLTYTQSAVLSSLHFLGFRFHHLNLTREEQKLSATATGLKPLKPISKAPRYRPNEGVHWHTIGRRIGARRRTMNKTGKTLETVAKETGIPIDYLKRIERGTARPTAERLQKLAVALHWTLAELMRS